MANRNGRHGDPAFLPLYAGQVASPHAWIGKAKELLVAASKLRPAIRKLWAAYRWNAHNRNQRRRLPIDLQGIYFGLVAFAMENLFKAEIVRRDSFRIREEVRRTGKIPKYLKTHDLVELARKIDFRATLQEEDLLRRLTRNAIWAGRYPFPTEFSASALSESFSNGKSYHVAYFGGDDLDRIRDLLAKARRHLPLVSRRVA